MAYRSRLAGWISLSLVSTVAVLLSACATLGPRVQGQTELVAWQATDLKLEQRVGGGRWSYSFELLILETRGMAVTFNMIDSDADACVGPNVPIPLWRIVMEGTDDRGQAVKALIDLTLPAGPPSPPQTTSKSVRAITLVPPRR